MARDTKKVNLKTKVEYIQIQSFPESAPQIWRLQYSIGQVKLNGRTVKMGQAILDGKARKKNQKVIVFNGFVTDWLSIKGCLIIGHDTDFFNFISPPKTKVKKTKNQELVELNALVQWQKNHTAEEKKS